MRISDWSSDVCSSDLQFSKYAFELPQGNLGQASFPVVYAEPDLRVTELTLPEEMAAGSTVTISFKVENVGNRATREDNWIDRVYLSLDASPDEADWRSEERRVGQESVRTCRSRWSPSQSKIKKGGYI